MRLTTHRLVLLGLSLLAAGVLSWSAIGQEDTTPEDDCPEIVTTALEAAELQCEAAGRNQVCYGNISLQAEARETVENFTFTTVGDITDVVNIQTLRLDPLNVDAQTWGVAIMRLQTNLPDALPGQNVTFVLFGDVEITNAVDSDDDSMTPMQAFYLSTGIGDASCEEAPDSGLLVQTPEGIGEVSFVVNEVEVSMGSTVLFQAEPEGEMIVTAVEGAAVLNVEDEAHPVVAGTRVRMAIDRELRPRDRPQDPEAYDMERIGRLPIGTLERPIEVQEAFSDVEIEDLRDRWGRGEALCGEEPYPPCDDLPVLAGGLPCLVLPPGAERRAEDADRPLCDLEFEELSEADEERFFGADDELPFADRFDFFDDEDGLIPLDELLDEYFDDEDRPPFGELDALLDEYFGDEGRPPLEELLEDYFNDENLPPLDELEDMLPDILGDGDRPFPPMDDEDEDRPMGVLPGDDDFGDDFGDDEGDFPPGDDDFGDDFGDDEGDFPPGDDDFFDDEGGERPLPPGGDEFPDGDGSFPDDEPAPPRGGDDEPLPPRGGDDGGFPDEEPFPPDDDFPDDDFADDFPPEDDFHDEEMPPPPGG